MVDENAPISKISEVVPVDAEQSTAAPRRGLADQLRSEAIVQSANLFLVARRILATSLGAIALSLDETNEFIARLVERGEGAEHELAALLEDLSAQISVRGKGLVQHLPGVSSAQPVSDETKSAAKRVPQQEEAQHAAPKRTEAKRPEAQRSEAVARSLSPEPAPAALGERVEGILGRLNVPTRGDIESITSKIEILSNKVLLLKNRTSHGRAPTPETNDNGSPPAPEPSEEPTQG